MFGRKKVLRHLLSFNDLSKKEVHDIIELASKIKQKPKKYEDELKRKSLLMMFAKPSLRTYLSFDIAMFRLGGHPIFYDVSHSVLGKKESMKDFSAVASRYVSAIMARLYEHNEIVELAKYSSVPIINGLTNYYHPCQILGDLLTIKEKFGRLEGLRLCYLGDSDNNVTHCLIMGCNKVGMEIVVSCPKNKLFLPNPEAIGKNEYIFEENPIKAVQGANIVYTDSWMSYHIPKSQETKRIKILNPYQINSNLFNIPSNPLFMHCLPATRGHEVTDEVIDSSRSIVYDQAENRVYAEKAVLLKLVNGF